MSFWTAANGLILAVVSTHAAQSETSQVHILANCSSNGNSMHFSFHEIASDEAAMEVMASCEREDVEFALRFAPHSCGDGVSRWLHSFEVNGRAISSTPEEGVCETSSRPKYGWVQVRGAEYLTCSQISQPTNVVRHTPGFSMFSLDMHCIKNTIVTD